jgi:hypothetical protein
VKRNNEDREREPPKDRRKDRGSYDKEKKSNKNRMKNNLQQFVDNYNSGTYNDDIFDEEDFE